MAAPPSSAVIGTHRAAGRSSHSTVRPQVSGTVMAVTTWPATRAGPAGEPAATAMASAAVAARTKVPAAADAQIELASATTSSPPTSSSSGRCHAVARSVRRSASTPTRCDQRRCGGDDHHLVDGGTGRGDDEPARGESRGRSELAQPGPPHRAGRRAGAPRGTRDGECDQPAGPVGQLRSAEPPERGDAHADQARHRDVQRAGTVEQLELEGERDPQHHQRAEQCGGHARRTPRPRRHGRAARSTSPVAASAATQRSVVRAGPLVRVTADRRGDRDAEQARQPASWDLPPRCRRPRRPRPRRPPAPSGVVRRPRSRARPCRTRWRRSPRSRRRARAPWPRTPLRPRARAAGRPTAATSRSRDRPDGARSPRPLTTAATGTQTHGCCCGSTGRNRPSAATPRTHGARLAHGASSSRTSHECSGRAERTGDTGDGPATGQADCEADGGEDRARHDRRRQGHREGGPVRRRVPGSSITEEQHADRRGGTGDLEREPCEVVRQVGEGDDRRDEQPAGGPTDPGRQAASQPRPCEDRLGDDEPQGDDPRSQPRAP